MGNNRTAAFVSESTLKEAINNRRCYFESVYYKHSEQLLEKSATARGKTKMLATGGDCCIKGQVCKKPITVTSDNRITGCSGAQCRDLFF